MKQTIVFFVLFFALNTLFSEEWTTLKRKETLTQSITIAVSDTELCTLASTSVYSDGIVIFYCHAGISDKYILDYTYDFLESELKKNESRDMIKLTSEIINDFRNNGILTALYFETEEPGIIGTIRSVKTHFYCSSWIEKVAADTAKKFGLSSKVEEKKQISTNLLDIYLNKYKEVSCKNQITEDYLVESIKIQEKAQQESYSVENQSNDKTDTKITMEETVKPIAEPNKQKRGLYDAFSLSIAGGASLDKNSVFDLNLSIWVAPNLFLVLQGGGTAVNDKIKKISSSKMMPEFSMGLGVNIKPLNSYKMNLFGYGSVGFSHLNLHCGWIDKGEYKTDSFYKMIRGCIGINYALNPVLFVFVQDCYDYGFSLEHTNHISVGITLKGYNLK